MNSKYHGIFFLSRLQHLLEDILFSVNPHEPYQSLNDDDCVLVTHFDSLQAWNYLLKSSMVLESTYVDEISHFKSRKHVGSCFLDGWKVWPKPNLLHNCCKLYMLQIVCVQTFQIFTSCFPTQNIFMASDRYPQMRECDLMLPVTTTEK